MRFAPDFPSFVLGALAMLLLIGVVQDRQTQEERPRRTLLRPDLEEVRFELAERPPDTVVSSGILSQLDRLALEDERDWVAGLPIPPWVASNSETGLPSPSAGSDAVTPVHLAIRVQGGRFLVLPLQEGQAVDPDIPMAAVGRCSQVALLPGEASETGRWASESATQRSRLALAVTAIGGCTSWAERLRIPASPTPRERQSVADELAGLGRGVWPAKVRFESSDIEQVLILPHGDDEVVAVAARRPASTQMLPPPPRPALAAVYRRFTDRPPRALQLLYVEEPHTRFSLLLTEDLGEGRSQLLLAERGEDHVDVLDVEIVPEGESVLHRRRVLSSFPAN